MEALLKKTIPQLIIWTAIFFAPVSFAKENNVISSENGIITELWEGTVLTASFKAGMCFTTNGSAYGVLILKHANGSEDIYHLNGSIKNNSFDLAHSSGHYFKGRLTDSNNMEGTVKLNNGLKLSLKGKRILDVPLAKEDCAPIR